MTASDIKKAVDLLRAGELVAFPTETVYGLGADARNETAVQKVFLAKGRPADHPLIVHLANYVQLKDWAREVSPDAILLAKAFWPGPLTLVFKKQPSVLDSITGGQDTVGIRIPRHPVAAALLQAFGDGIVAPSANQFTHVSPTTSEAVAEELGDQVSLILDGGDCEVGLESTIVDMTGATPRILRPGMITAEQIGELLGKSILTDRQDTPVRAPGMHHVHYAPRTPLQVWPTDVLLKTLSRIDDVPVAVMRYTQASWPVPTGVDLIQMSQDPFQYAHDLYRVLRSLDTQGFNRIVIEAVPESAAWDAIRDRLERAAARITE